MSKSVQRHAKKIAERAGLRERTARERARAERERGGEETARVHERSADRQAETRRRGEKLLESDRQYEGDQLGESTAAKTP